MGWWGMRGDIPGQRVATHSHFFRRARGSATQWVRILEKAGGAAGFRIRGPEMAYTGGGQSEIPQTKGRAYCRAARLP